jgi:hypothetical protein
LAALRWPAAQLPLLPAFPPPQPLPPLRRRLLVPLAARVVGSPVAVAVAVVVVVVVVVVRLVGADGHAATWGRHAAPEPTANGRRGTT